MHGHGSAPPLPSRQQPADALSGAPLAAARQPIAPMGGLSSVSEAHADRDTFRELCTCGNETKINQMLTSKAGRRGRAPPPLCRPLWRGACQHRGAGLPGIARGRQPHRARGRILARGASFLL